MALVQWYPGHMAKAKRELKEQLNLADLVIEVVDARLPLSSRNPDLKLMLGKKRTMIVLNKADLITKEDAKLWVDYYKSKGEVAIPLDSLHKANINKLLSFLNDEIEVLRKSMSDRGRKLRPLRVLMVGIPNTGKSSLINGLIGKKRLKVGNMPGLTRSLQWVRVNENWELMDTPGLLWPKLDNQLSARKLGIIGSVSKDGHDEEESAYFLLKWLSKEYPDNLKERYKLDSIPDEVEYLVDAIGRNRGMILPCGKVKEYEVSKLVLKEFRKGLLGKQVLEKPVMYD